MRVPRSVLAICALASAVVLVIAVLDGDWWVVFLAACGTFGAGVGALQD